MQSVIEKAEVLIEALPYIQEFRDKLVVIKVGGSAMEDSATVERLLTDIAFMECVGMRTVIVHGGGKAISRGMRNEGIDSRFLHGLRVTCEKSIEVVQKVIKGEVNPSIVKTLCGMGASAACVHGEDIFRVAYAVFFAVSPHVELFHYPGHLPYRRVSQSIAQCLRVGGLLLGVTGTRFDVGAHVCQGALFCLG